MKSRVLRLLAAALMGVSGVAGAQVLEGTSTDPTGIDGLVVDGTTYDVAFNTTTLNSFTQGSTLSTDAANALTTALNTLGVTALGGGPSGDAAFYLAIDDTLSPTDGVFCSTTFTSSCTGPWLSVPYDGIVQITGLGSHGLVAVGGGVAFYTEAADFTAVPIPASIWLILSGLAGLSLTGWRRGQTASV